MVDSRGNPVEDLRAPDFAVKIDGQVRRVVSAELVKVDVEKARRQTGDKTESFYTSNLTPEQRPPHRHRRRIESISRTAHCSRSWPRRSGSSTG